CDAPVATSTRSTSLSQFDGRPLVVPVVREKYTEFPSADHRTAALAAREPAEPGERAHRVGEPGTIARPPRRAADDLRVGARHLHRTRVHVDDDDFRLIVRRGCDHGDAGQNTVRIPAR